MAIYQVHSAHVNGQYRVTHMMDQYRLYKPKMTPIMARLLIIRLMCI